MFFIYIILDTTPPIVTFSQPPALTKAVAQLRWISNENAVFHCSLDNADFVDCGEGVSSLWVGTALRDGEHTLKVRATDDAGNIATPQRWTWRTGKRTHSIQNQVCLPAGALDLIQRFSLAHALSF